jgi:hypothetical protein
MSDRILETELMPARLVKFCFFQPPLRSLSCGSGSLRGVLFIPIWESGTQTTRLSPTLM